MADVTLEGISKVFHTRTGEVRAVDNLDLVVRDEELLVLLGPSGCGKTTTLRLIAGLEDPTAGTIHIGPTTVNHIAPKDRNIAMVFQSYALYPHMTVRKNLSFGLKMRRVPKVEIKRKVDDVSRLLSIDHLLHRKPGALSGGECQRVALGRAIVREPQVFLFDEPLSNLDAMLRTRMRTEIKSLHRDLRTTMIYVTHDQEEAMTLGDRMAVLRQGRVQQCGTPLDVYNQPANRFVAGFIGNPPMNFLTGFLEGDGSARVFVHEGGRLQLPQEFQASLAHCLSEPVVLGIRPEHLFLNGRSGQAVGAAKPHYGSPRGLTESGESAQAQVCGLLGEMTIHLVEPLGDVQNVHLVSPSGVRITVRLSPTTTLSSGARVRVFVDANQVHLFSSDEDGRRLDPAPHGSRLSGV